MFKTGSDQNKSARDKLESPANEDELRSSVEYIGREAEALQKIAAEHGYDFLSYILKIAVLETEIILGKRQLNTEESQIDSDKEPKFIC